MNKGTAAYKDEVAKTFRQWVPICTIPFAAKGRYMIQVKTNDVGNNNANGHNRFAIRAYSTSDSNAKNKISLAGYNKMAMYANLPDAVTKFYLARVPSRSAGQTLNLRLWDVGDSTAVGKIKVLPPSESSASFTNCKATGAWAGTLSTCELTNVYSGNGYNGAWEQISVPIPTTYTCTDSDPTKCWVKLQFTYGANNQPSDTTSWTASIEGDPVRLVE